MTFAYVAHELIHLVYQHWFITCILGGVLGASVATMRAPAAIRSVRK